MFCLKGYAGTGKTYTIARFIEGLLAKHPKWRIAMTAPTNKAVQVLRETATFQNEQVEYKTIHSLLGLKEKITDSGDIEFERDLNEPQPEIRTRFKVIIIDEVSMLQDKLFYDIRRYINDVKIILMGDPAQIPPVGKDDCEPFLNPEEHGIIEYQLTKIMRQGDGSAIVHNAFQIRQNLASEGHQWQQGSDLRLLATPAQRPDIVRLFKESFEGAEHLGGVRAIAWTNRKVREYNDYIRTLFYGPEKAQERYIPGEMLVMNKPFVATSVNGQADEFLLQTNQEISIQSLAVDHMDLDNEKQYKVFIARVSFIDTKGKESTGEILLIHPDSEHAFIKKCNQLRDAAIHSPFGERKGAWKWYYAVLRSVADVNYAYAITAHKSQGSTYDTAIVDVKNIMLNENVVERNRILYTAITRAKNQLHIIT